MATRVLVTGARGFVGVPLAIQLRAEGCDVTEISRDDGDIATLDLSRKFADHHFDKVIHQAGKTFVPDSWTDPVSFYQTNVLGTANVANYCRLVGADLIFVSAYIYGQPKVLPISEDSAANPSNPYAQSKFLAEQICRDFSASFGLKATIVRPFNIFGPGQPNSFLIPTIIDQVLHGEMIEVQDISPKRDYIYIDDFVSAMVLLTLKPAVRSVYNVGSGYSVSVAELIEMAQQSAGSSKQVLSRGATRQNEVMDVVADITRLSDEFGWRPKVTVRDGISRMLHAWPVA